MLLSFIDMDCNICSNFTSGSSVHKFRREVMNQSLWNDAIECFLIIFLFASALDAQHHPSMDALKCGVYGIYIVISIYIWICVHGKLARSVTRALRPTQRFLKSELERRNRSYSSYNKISGSSSSSTLILISI